MILAALGVKGEEKIGHFWWKYQLQMVQVYAGRVFGKIWSKNWWAEFDFSKDNASIHSSKSPKEHFLRTKIRLFYWASKSSGLNPIENVWGIMVVNFTQMGISWIMLHGFRRQFLMTWEKVEKVPFCSWVRPCRVEFS